MEYHQQGSQLYTSSEVGSYRSNTDVLVFGGSTSAHHGLSNFYEDTFVYEHIAYNTAEQACQHKKARCAGNQNMQREIMFHLDAARVGQWHLPAVFATGIYR